MLLLIIIFAVIVFLCFVMGLNLAFAILAVLLLVLIAYRGIALYKEKQKLDKHKNKLDIVNVEKGGVFKLTGVGENSEELTLKVLAKHLYKEGDYCWYELECDKGSEEKVFVDVEIDDYIEVSVVLEKLKMSDIHLSASLEKIDDEEMGKVRYKGMSLPYDESDSAVFYRFCDDKKGEQFYYWDFSIGNNIISIEKWGNKDYEVYYCQKMKPSQIQVLSNKGE